MSNFVGNNTFIHTKSWVIDSGATHRVCNDISMFEYSVPIQNIKVTLPNGVAYPIVKVGSILLSKDIRLHNVLFVPNFRYNILSVSSFTYTLPFSMVFTRDDCIIQEPSQGKMIGKCSRTDKLYQLEFEKISDNKPCVVASCKCMGKNPY